MIVSGQNYENRGAPGRSHQESNNAKSKYLIGNFQFSEKFHRILTPMCYLIIATTTIISRRNGRMGGRGRGRGRGNGNWRRRTPYVPMMMPQPMLQPMPQPIQMAPPTYQMMPTQRYYY